jgi:N-acetylmuramic acid 6-phosphate etherase
MRLTESDSNFNDLEKMNIDDLLIGINSEDYIVANAVEAQITEIGSLVTCLVDLIKKGGRLFYMGAGTSGRLGILDASECPPTYGVSHDLVIGIIAGGDTAIRKAVENAEDNELQGWLDLQKYNVNSKDMVVGISASGSTPYVSAALEKCQQMKINTGCIVCNIDSRIAKASNFPIEVITGPEFVTGSTRMKAGTATKMVLNMIQLGKVKGNKMVDMQLSNEKLVDRGARMIQEELETSYEESKQLLKKYGSVRKAIDSQK